MYKYYYNNPVSYFATILYENSNYKFKKLTNATNIKLRKITFLRINECTGTIRLRELTEGLFPLVIPIIPFPRPQPLAATILLSVTMILTILGTPY